jgi:hypothetical protein
MKCREGSLIEMGRCNSNITLGAMKQRETQRSVLSKSQKLQDSHMTRVAVYIIETVFAIIIRTFQKLKLRMLLPSSPIFHATQIMGNGLCNCSTNLSALSFQLTGNLQDLQELRNLRNAAKLYESSQWACDHHPTPTVLCTGVLWIFPFLGLSVWCEAAGEDGYDQRWHLPQAAKERK